MLETTGVPDAELDVTVVLPIYDEAGHLEQELERIRAGLRASEFSYEIIAIDDGSSDGSTELLLGMADDDDLRVLVFENNRGAGSARRIGSQLARGAAVVWTDVDMTYPNGDIADLVRQLPGSDHVVGARTSEEGTLKLLRSPAKWLIRMLAQVLVGQPIPDLNSGFRAFRADVARQYLHLLPTGFSCVTTLTLAFMANGYHVRFTPIPYAPRAGESKFHWWTDTRRYLLQIVRMILMHNPLRIIGPIGITLLLAGLGKFAYDAITDPIAIAINTVVLLTVAGVVLAVGMLADLFVQLSSPRAEVLPASRGASTTAEVGATSQV